MTDATRGVEIVRAPRRVSNIAPRLGIDWELGWWSEGYRSVCGVDEVGRGALAGPLVAAAVQFSSSGATDDRLDRVTDSKTLDRVTREQLSALVLSCAEAVGIGEVCATEIDEIGVGPANRLAMTRAVSALTSVPEVIFLDAMTIDIDTLQVGLIDGDARCLSIAAASIVAKVYRDRLMTAMARTHAFYGFERHAGYGTARHLDALRVHGPCVEHRRSFAPVRRLVGQ